MSCGQFLAQEGSRKEHGIEFRADQQFQLVFFGRNVCAHYPRERAFVGYGERRVTKLGRALDEFLRARSPAQKGEIADAMQLGVRR